MRVGRDHIASTVYTLVLAYTGAALPLLILFLLSNRNFAEVATTSIVAEEVVRTLVGSLGLILCVPLTTALAAVAAKADHSAVRHNGRSASTSARTRKGAQGSAKAAGSPQREQAGNANQRGEAGRRGSPKHGKGDGDRNKARPTSSSDRSPKGRPVAKGDKNPKAKWGAPIGETLQEAESQRRPPPILPESPNISSISSVSKPKETKRVKRRWLGLRKARPTNFHETRKMTRRERKFWRDD